MQLPLTAHWLEDTGDDVPVFVCVYAGERIAADSLQLLHEALLERCTPIEEPQ